MRRSARCLPMATCSCASLLGRPPSRVLGVVSLCLDRIGRTAGGGRRRAGTRGRAGSRIRAAGNDEGMNPTARATPPNRAPKRKTVNPVVASPEIRSPSAHPNGGLVIVLYLKLIILHTDTAAVSGFLSASLHRVLHPSNVNTALASSLCIPVGVGFRVDHHERCRSRGWVVGA